MQSPPYLYLDRESDPTCFPTKITRKTLGCFAKKSQGRPLRPLGSLFDIFCCRQGPLVYSSQYDAPKKDQIHIYIVKFLPHEVQKTFWFFPFVTPPPEDYFTLWNKTRHFSTTPCSCIWKPSLCMYIRKDFCFQLFPYRHAISIDSIARTIRFRCRPRQKRPFHFFKKATIFGKKNVKNGCLDGAVLAISNKTPDIVSSMLEKTPNLASSKYACSYSLIHIH